jgi:hypothetical protein
VVEPRRRAGQKEQYSSPHRGWVSSTPIVSLDERLAGKSLPVFLARLSAYFFKMYGGEISFLRG